MSDGGALGGTFWLAHGPVQRQSDCGGLLCTDCTRRMVYRLSWWPCCASRVAGARRLRVAQHGTNVVAFPRGCLLSDTGTSHRRGVDDGPWTLWRNCQILCCCRTGPSELLVRTDLHTNGNSRVHRRRSVVGQTIPQSRSQGGRGLFGSQALDPKFSGPEAC